MITIDVTMKCDSCGADAKGIGFPEQVDRHLFVFAHERLEKRIYGSRLTGWEFVGRDLFCRDCMAKVKASFGEGGQNE